LDWKKRAKEGRSIPAVLLASGRCCSDSKSLSTVQVWDPDQLQALVFYLPILFLASRLHRKVSNLFKKLAMDYKLVEDWAKLNAKLEAGWAPYRDLVAQRDEIEKQIPWLKGHGASPYPSKAPLPVLSSSPAPKPETRIEGLPPSGSKRNRSEQEAKKKLEKVRAQGGSGTSPSATPLSGDTTQNFAGGKN
jgi:hypothetical protein